MALTATYFWPVATPGTTTPPASSAAPPTNITSSVRFNQVDVEVTGDGTSTTIVLTHNLEITPTELTQLWPEVRFEPIVASAPSPYVVARASNTVTVAFVGTSLLATHIVRISRPFSATR
jgi:hypothetical protein